MHDYCESNPDDMRNPLMAERVRYFKRTPKGVTHMCEIFDEIRQEGFERGFERGFQQGFERGFQQEFERGLKRASELGEERALLSCAQSLMGNLSFSAQQALDVLGVEEPRRSRLLAILQGN